MLGIVSATQYSLLAILIKCLAPSIKCIRHCFIVSFQSCEEIVAKHQREVDVLIQQQKARKKSQEDQERIEKAEQEIKNLR